MILRKKPAKLLFTTALLLSVSSSISLNAYAALPDSLQELNDPEMFFKQHTDYTCTLASATMLIKRTARAMGDFTWPEVTEESVGSVAWLGDEGLTWDFSAHGISIAHDYLPGGEANRAFLMEYLEEHPEGIVIFSEYRSHAILITDYTDDEFYAADPWPYDIPGGRIPVEEAWISIEDADAYWYVSSPDTTKLSAESTESALLSDSGMIPDSEMILDMTPDEMPSGFIIPELSPKDTENVPGREFPSFDEVLFPLLETSSYSWYNKIQ